MPLRALTVLLHRGKTQQQLPTAVEQAYLGGRGVIAWMLYYQLASDTAPLSAANLLIFAAGPLAGHVDFAASGFIVGTRSPFTGGIAYSWAPGQWGAALRRAGYDLLILNGQAPEWCLLQIDHARVVLRPATHVLGLDTIETTWRLQAELGSDYVIICIGPAAEAGVAYSSIVAEGRYLAEPAGVGAVMAHKRVKAIAVRGNQPLPVRDERKLTVALNLIRQRMEHSPLAQSLQRSGSMHYFTPALERGALTQRNGQDGLAAAHLYDLPAVLAQRGQHNGRTYTGVPIPLMSDPSALRDQPLPLPELEMVAGFSARCGITDADAVLSMADLCLRLGLDPVATSAAMAFMMECQEAGLNHAGTLRWGDAQAVLAALTRLGIRRDKRDVLSLGVDEMQDIFYKSDRFAPQVKGLAMPTLDPRALTGIALAMATAPIGGDYRYAMMYEELLESPPTWLPDAPAPPQATNGKVVRLIWHERLAAMLDAAGICRRLGLMAYQITPGEVLALINAVSEVPLSAADMGRLGERVVTLERLFALKYGYKTLPDELPPRWQEAPLREGVAAGYVPPLAELLPEYYRRHGWNSAGRPPASRLNELGIKK